MPTTFVGLLLFIGFLTPGFVYVSQRRGLAPQAERSVLMETTGVVSVSLVTNAIVLALFGLLRWATPAHTPDVGALLSEGAEYAIDHLPYVLGWAAALLVASCAMAVVAARHGSLRKWLSGVFPPVILESSAWCETLRADPGNYVHAGVELAGGDYVSGRVVWFSTDLEETGDRDIVLGPPLRMRTDAGVVELETDRLIVSARQIRRLHVDQVRDRSGRQDADALSDES